MKFILGSGSPRRKELLAQLGIVPDAILPPDIDEDPKRSELPRPYCARLAREKVAAVVSDPDDIVLCADTTVALGRRILGKPADAADAVAMLRQLSGRRHQVLTALVLHDPASGQRQSACSVSDVWFDTLDDARIDAYVATGEPFGKAGSYGIQGRAAAWVARIAGSFSGIVGLPLFELDQLLRTDPAGRRGER